MRVLITGATGLIGSALLDRLRGSVDCIFCQSRSFHEDEPAVKWIKHDLVEHSWDSVALHDIDVVYHLAGQTSTYQAKQNPIEDLSVNVVGLLKLLDFFRSQATPPIVVIAGTATEVGLTDELPINEALADRPATFYDISKLTAEMYLKQYVEEGWIRGCALRFANVYGRGRWGQSADRGIVDKIFNRAVAGQTISIYGDGNYLRDYIFIDDVVSALIMAADSIVKTNGQSFYIGTGQGTTLTEAFLKIISQAAIHTGIRTRYEYVAPPADFSKIEYRNAIIDASAFTQATGWRPKYDFETGLQTAYKPVAP
jgi:nucleoside-diphosphate-sugar epimerase